MLEIYIDTLKKLRVTVYNTQKKWHRHTEAHLFKANPLFLLPFIMETFIGSFFLAGIT